MSESSLYGKLTVKDISQQTYFLKEKLWFNNFAENLPLIRTGKNVLELHARCAGPAVIVGAGPSIEKFNMLDKLKDVPCHIIATDRMLAPLLKRGIVPEYVLSIDGDPKISQFYLDKRLWTNRDRIKAIFNVQVSPEVVRSFPGEVFWFTVLMDNPVQDAISITRAMYWMTKEVTMSQSYGNVGGFAWAFTEFLGHDPIILAGIDFSYGEGVQPTQTEYWQGFLAQRKGRTQDVIRLDYKYVNNPFKHRVLTDAVWMGYGEVLHHAVEATSVKTVQCSPLTSFFGPRIITMELEEALRKYTLRLSTQPKVPSVVSTAPGRP